MLNGKPVVLVDCDDVVCQCLKGMAELSFKKTGVEVPLESLTKWDFFDTVSHPDHPDLRKWVEEKMQEPGWCYKLETFPEAVDGIRRLKEICELFFVTAPFKGEHWPHERRTWLQEHFNMEHWRILQTSTKFLVRGELFIDDKIEHCIDWEKYGKEIGAPGIAAIWDRPHNRDPKGDPFYRFTNWDSVVELIRKGW